MIYQYTKAFLNKASNKLVHELRAQRARDKPSGFTHRPILFIGFGMGGSIIMKTLSIAKGSVDRSELAIAMCTVGVILFGGPRLKGRSMINGQSEKALSDIPANDLISIRQSFVLWADQRHVPIVSLYESVDLHGNQPMVNQDIGHTFEGSKDPAFVSLAEVIEQMADRALEKWTPLHIAAEQGDDSTVNKALQKSKTNPNSRDHVQCTALHHAVLGGYQSIVATLLKSGAMTHCIDDFGQSPLSLSDDLGLSTLSLSEINRYENISRQLKGHQIILGAKRDYVDAQSRRLHMRPNEEGPTICKKFNVLFWHYTSVNDEDELVKTASPDQKMPQRGDESVYTMLYEKSFMDFKQGNIWIHLPANNVEWIKARMRSAAYDKLLTRQKILAHKLCTVRKLDTLHVQKFLDKSLPNTSHDMNSQEFEFMCRTSPDPRVQSSDPFSVILPMIDVDISDEAVTSLTSLKSPDGRQNHATQKPQIDATEWHFISPHITHVENLAKLKTSYLFQDLGFRRSLDSSYYQSLNEQVVRNRDRNQVLTRFLDERLSKSPSPSQKIRTQISGMQILVESQFWMVRIGKGILITSFSEKRDISNGQNLATALDGAILNAYDLGRGLDSIDEVSHILLECIRFIERPVFLAGTNIAHPRAYGVTIATLSSQVQDSYYRFSQSIGRISKTLLDDLRIEIDYLRQIDNALDEINMIKRVLYDQKRIIEKSRLLEEKFHPRGDFKHPVMDVYDRFEEDAKRVRQSLVTLLDLRQKEAAIDEAISASEQSRTLFIFTAATVVFAPLSFAAAVMAIKVKGYPDVFGGRAMAASLGGSLAATLGLIWVGAWAYPMLSKIRKERSAMIQSSTNEVTMVEPRKDKTDRTMADTTKARFSTRFRDGRRADVENVGAL